MNNFPIIILLLFFVALSVDENKSKLSAIRNTLLASRVKVILAKIEQLFNWINVVNESA